MSIENKDLPAFPAMDANYRDGVATLELRYDGLSKREYFTAMAMQGILAGTNKDDDRYHVNGGYLHPESVADVSVTIADAILLELSKTPNP